MASRVVELAPEEDAFNLIRRSWSVPVLAVTGSPKRFSVIKSSLGGITDRALSQSLAALEEQRWMQRDINLSQRTPYPTYQVVNAGTQINQVIALDA